MTPCFIAVTAAARPVIQTDAWYPLAGSRFRPVADVGNTATFNLWKNLHPLTADASLHI